MKTFNIKVSEGDAIIKLNSDKVVQLIFGEDDRTIIKEVEWHEQEVYKAAVLFALMIDTYFKNGAGLDEVILLSQTGNIAAELLGKDLLSISLAGVHTTEEENITEEELLKRLDEIKDNVVVNATTRFTKDD